MATVITSECINCGACEPECPNTAIYQGGVEWELDGQSHAPLSQDIFYIVPEKCTECVGFYDREACAAVCPVDCCVPDPNRVETEEELIVRARVLHPEVEFGEGFPSCFRKEGGEVGAVGAAEGGDGAAEVAVAKPAPAPTAPAAAPAAVTKPAPAPTAPAATAKPAPTPAPTAPAAAPAAAAKPAPAPQPTPVVSQPAPAVAQEVLSVTIPEVEEWEVPISCFHCDGEYTVPFKHFKTGVVFRCPHCTGSFVITSTMYKNVANALDEFPRHWVETFEKFQERRRRELEAFEEKQRQELEAFNERLKKVNTEVNPPGKLRRRLSLFGFQRVG